MKKTVSIVAAAAAMVIIHAIIAAATEPYYPYQMYDDYYKTHSVSPPPGYQPPPPPPPPATHEVKRPRSEQPLLLTQAPEFLFPPPLNFGVAVGIPYDLFYVSKVFYLYKDGLWYRSASYRGPWTKIPVTLVPQELRKQKLGKVHELRNAEFQKYFKNKKGYQGRVFRPEEEIPEGQKNAPPPSPKQ
jgi:hypothetical protein